MRRADRLFQIVQHLRGRRLTTARQLADKLVVSERTVYRDIRDLTLSGVPIEGEAGVGYILRGGFDIPPPISSAKSTVRACSLWILRLGRNYRQRSIRCGKPSTNNAN